MADIVEVLNQWRSAFLDAVRHAWSAKETRFRMVEIVTLVLGFCSIAFGAATLVYSAVRESTQQNPSNVEVEPTPLLQLETVKETPWNAIAVTGAVKTPGVYTFPEGSRVGEAIASAGGFLRQADRSWVDKKLNTAEKITDEMHVYIPYEGEVVEETAATEKTKEESATSNTSSAKVSVNTGARDELMGLNGIGEVRATAIIANRPYTSLEEFQTKNNFGESVMNGIRDAIQL